MRDTGAAVDSKESVDAPNLESSIWDALQDVVDPEIPTLSVVELGMVLDVHCTESRVQVQMVPTFVGCPALAIIRKNVVNRLMQVPSVVEASVDFVFDTPWTTERISEQGRQKLREFGIAPPKCSLAQQRVPHADCPFCGSSNTRLDNMFGPTACRSVYYCNDCKQPFEAMKPV